MFENIEHMAKLIGYISVISGVVITFCVFFKKMVEAVRCLLRSEMLRIYYHNKDSKKIRQYEYQNFVLLYKAYKALRGNSFIDEIYEKIQDWDIVS